MDAEMALDLSDAPSFVITMIIQSRSLNDRATCALVCKAWAKAAAAHSIILEHVVQKDLSCLQRWLKTHGRFVKVLQLRECEAALTALPCPQLQDLQVLQLHGPEYRFRGCLSIGSRAWSDIAAATKLTSVSLWSVQTASQQAEVVSALTALTDLQHLTWDVNCDSQSALSDSVLLQKLTKLTSLKLCGVKAAALQHLSLLTQLQHLSISAAREAAAKCPGLEELTALTSLELSSVDDILPSVIKLTALQQLTVESAKLTALNGLQVLTRLTHLRVQHLGRLPPQSPPLQLPDLQHLEMLVWGGNVPVAMSFLASCTQLRVLSLQHCSFSGPGSLVASSMLQHLELNNCRIAAADGAAWQQVFPGPRQLPHLTSLQLTDVTPALQPSDMERVVACCSSLQMLSLDNSLQGNSYSALVGLPDLTCLHLGSSKLQNCSSQLAQLTGLRELRMKLNGGSKSRLLTASLRQLAALQQLTSLGFRGVHLVPHVKRHLYDTLPGCSRAIVNKAPAGCPPDVSSRLLRACDLADAANGGS